MSDDEEMTGTGPVYGPTARDKSAKSFTVPRPDQWSKLPLKLRQRWWRETDYGRQAPNTQLVEAIREAIAANDEQVK